MKSGYLRFFFITDKYDISLPILKKNVNSLNILFKDYNSFISQMLKG